MRAQCVQRLHIILIGAEAAARLLDRLVSEHVSLQADKTAAGKHADIHAGYGVMQCVVLAGSCACIPHL